MAFLVGPRLKSIALVQWTFVPNFMLLARFTRFFHNLLTPRDGHSGRIFPSSWACSWACWWQPPTTTYTIQTLARTRFSILKHGSLCSPQTQNLPHRVIWRMLQPRRRRRQVFLMIFVCSHLLSNILRSNKFLLAIIFPLRYTQHYYTLQNSVAIPRDILWLFWFSYNFGLVWQRKYTLLLLSYSPLKNVVISKGQYIQYYYTAQDLSCNFW